MSDTALTPLAFDILLTLADGDAHGYAIMQAARERAGSSRVHAGTLYRALARMVDTGLIRELEDAPDGDSDERRRYYALTPEGRSAARAEARRLEEKVGAARSLGLLEPA